MSVLVVGLSHKSAPVRVLERSAVSGDQLTKLPTMYLRSIRALQADALFASALRRGDEVNAGQIRQAIAVSLDTYGGAGCVGRVAQEFGDHPETAAVRMRWAQAAAAVS